MESKSLFDEVVRLYDGRMSQTEIAAQLGISRYRVIKTLDHVRKLRAGEVDMVALMREIREVVIRHLTNHLGNTTDQSKPVPNKYHAEIYETFPDWKTDADFES